MVHNGYVRHEEHFQLRLCKMRQAAVVPRVLSSRSNGLAGALAVASVLCPARHVAAYLHWPVSSAHPGLAVASSPETRPVD